MQRIKYLFKPNVGFMIIVLITKLIQLHVIWMVEVLFVVNSGNCMIWKKKIKKKDFLD